MARAATGVVAALAVAWFGLAAYQSHAVSRATALASHHDPSSARHAAELLGDAATLNPDEAVNVLRGQLALAQGDAAAARRILNQVVRREPQDLAAWIALAGASTHRFRQRQIALLHILKLAPIVQSVG